MKSYAVAVVRDNAKRGRAETRSIQAPDRVFGMQRLFGGAASNRALDAPSG